MTVALQIRDVPDDIRDLLAQQARTRGQSLQAYLLELVMREATLGSKADMFFRTEHLRFEVPPELDPVAIMGEVRDDGFDKDWDGYDA